MGQLFAKQKPKSRVTDEDKAILVCLMKCIILYLLFFSNWNWNGTIWKWQSNATKRTWNVKSKWQKNFCIKAKKSELILKFSILCLNFSRALLLLKKKRLEESRIEQIEKHLMKIEEMVSDIEMAQMNKNVLENLYQGSRALQTINRVCFSISSIFISTNFSRSQSKKLKR